MQLSFRLRRWVANVESQQSSHSLEYCYIPPPASMPLWAGISYSVWAGVAQGRIVFPSSRGWCWRCPISRLPCGCNDYSFLHCMLFSDSFYIPQHVHTAEYMLNLSRLFFTWSIRSKWLASQAKVEGWKQFWKSTKLEFCMYLKLHTPPFGRHIHISEGTILRLHIYSHSRYSN